MDKVYVYKDRSTGAVLFVVEADNILIANSLLLAYGSRNKIKIEIASMEISLHAFIKEDSNESRR